MPKKKRGRGRPPEYTMPERIDASPEEIAQAVLSVPNKKREDWRYLTDKKNIGVAAGYIFPH